ncbi:MAG: alpha/beta hydrolase [Xanthobacteraceae bacterium]|nr:alpha/beta hydrolase [Xanthobacteraceae bacterium]
MPVIKAGAYDLDITDTGSGPVVILIHSSASGLRQWRALTDSLKDRYRVIAVNLFGYGGTAAWPAARPLTAADQAELVVAAAGLAGGPVALVGHSLGGLVALEAAARLGHRVRVVIVFEPILFGHLATHGPAEAYEEIVTLAQRFDELAKVGDWSAAGECFVDYWARPGSFAAMPEERRQNTLAMLPPVVHEWAMAASGLRPLEGWSAITAPVHVIRAADSRIPTRAIVDLLAKAYPEWHLHEVPSGGHMAPLARPDLVNPVIARVLDGATR